MILKLFRKSPSSDAVHAVYSAIVAQSRQPAFYAEWGVPDTVTGRFDMISLHLVLLFRRLRADKKDGAAFSQAVFDLFFLDMDRSLREMGVSDIGVPKKIQKMGNLFYGLLGAVNEAMDAGDHARLVQALRRNLFDESDAAPVEQLAEYLERSDKALATHAIGDIVAGKLNLEQVV